MYKRILHTKNCWHYKRLNGTVIVMDKQKSLSHDFANAGRLTWVEMQKSFTHFTIVVKIKMH